MELQRSVECPSICRSLLVTASKFADAIGVGQGRPYDYFLSRVDRSDTYKSVSAERDEWMRHGVYTEPIINEAYQLLTGNKTEQSGLWIPPVDDPLHGYCGCIPDGKVRGVGGSVMGLVEYKAPVHVLYSKEKHPPYGIPRRYMAQIQGEMGICGLPWCHFMGVCIRTKEISLFHVLFSSAYYQALSQRLLVFCAALQDWHIFHPSYDDLCSVAAIRQLQDVGLCSEWLSGEDEIPVESLIERDDRGRYRGPSGLWMTSDFLLGQGPVRFTDDTSRHVLRRVDMKLGHLPSTNLQCH